ncbi:MAG: (2Fe-2S) ferredoxin domain-containing protein [Planctomycetota bacterium]|jgi:(2Fe-2S) ferredoxin|nr:(2Fe-2S) ferredoxin domain-containing protein [Planctomycetota bacterium]MDP6942103.1 (2Fe-2S) ferredoxin domain-containing protein [Planctomycetota bacterium]
MPLAKKILFVCHAQRPPAVGESCGSQGAADFLQRATETLQAKMLWGPLRALASGCLGTCDRGPWAVVYPDNIWYHGFTPDDAEEIVSEHLENGRPVDRLVFSEGEMGEMPQSEGFEV